MAQAETSSVTGGEDGSAPVRESAYSSVAGDQYVTASAASSSSSQAHEYLTGGMRELEVLSLIEKSREEGWTELADGAADAAAPSPHGHDALIWEELRKMGGPSVFREHTDVKLGRLIAEGGQAHIYEASYDDDYSKLVVKVFKKGFSLADLKRQWPLSIEAPMKSPGYSQGNFVFGDIMGHCNLIHWGTFLEDGRFAFVMKRYAGDLRTLINLKLSDNNSQGPPFSHPQALSCMLEIAMGMGDLHARGALHRDLKAANILFEMSGDEFHCEVADYESSMFVKGTGFWRAPEVLKELQNKESDLNAEIWTEKVDVYSYAML